METRHKQQNRWFIYRVIEIFLGVRRKTSRFPFEHNFSTGPLVAYNIWNIINENLP